MASDGIIPAEIRAGPDAIRATVRDAMDAARDAAGDLVRRGTRRVFVIGNGTSYHSALGGAGLYARLAGPDDPLVIPLTAGEFQTYPPRLGRDDAVLGISASGEFVDVVAAFRDLAGRVPTIGIVHVPDSTLTTIADRIVRSAGGPSHVPVMTKTFSATLVATELTLIGLLGDDALNRLATGLLAAADDAAAAIESAERALGAVVDQLDRFQHAFVVGAGLAHVAALEAALKLKEIALVHAEGGETWEMTSGAATMIGPDAVVVALNPAGPGHDATAELVRHVADWGAATIEVSPRAAVDASILVPLPPASADEHAPLTAVPPVALAAFTLARRRGIDPDRPNWVARYHSQGLRHIVGVEEPA